MNRKTEELDEYDIMNIKRKALEKGIKKIDVKLKEWNDERDCFERSFTMNGLESAKRCLEQTIREIFEEV